MAKYRLLAQHVTPDGIMLEEGTEVGDGTAWAWRYHHNNEPMPPSNQMEGLDDEGRKNVADLHKKLYGDQAAVTHAPNEEVRKAREAEAKNQQKLDENSKPVSLQQRYERRLADMDEDEREDGRPNPPFVPPGPAAPATPTRGAPTAPHRTGVTRPSPGPATPKPPEEGDVRPGKPNEEQYPKG